MRRWRPLNNNPAVSFPQSFGWLVLVLKVRRHPYPKTVGVWASTTAGGLQKRTFVVGVLVGGGEIVPFHSLNGVSTVLVLFTWDKVVAVMGGCLLEEIESRLFEWKQRLQDSSS
jgi:hypothetical protein